MPVAQTFIKGPRREKEKKKKMMGVGGARALYMRSNKIVLNVNCMTKVLQFNVHVYCSKKNTSAQW